MTANKDFKRLVRTRMVRTGESYTAARAHLVRPATPEAPAASPPPAPPDYAALAGMSDATVKAKTGCDWKKWVGALDYAGAADWPHREIARYVREKFKVSGWWSQSVTVGYERIKGLRQVGQRRDGGFEASKSKTIPVPVSRLYAAFSQKRNRNRWLPEEQLTIRTSIPNRSLRFRRPDGTPVVAWFESKGPRKSTVSVNEAKLPDRDSAERVKREWGERLDRLATTLA